jgi:hypothetical protein
MWHLSVGVPGPAAGAVWADRTFPPALSPIPSEQSLGERGLAAKSDQNPRATARAPGTREDSGAERERPEGDEQGRQRELGAGHQDGRH